MLTNNPLFKKSFVSLLTLATLMGSSEAFCMRIGFFGFTDSEKKRPNRHENKPSFSNPDDVNSAGNISVNSTKKEKRSTDKDSAFDNESEGRLMIIGRELTPQEQTPRRSSLRRIILPETDESIFRASQILAESGDTKGMYDLANCYLEAKGCENSLENRKKAITWYEKAAFAGDVSSMVGLACSLAKAIGCEDSLENKEKAFFWTRKAAELGNHNGMFFLASFLYHAIGCEDSPGNKRLSVSWYEKSAVAGNVQAMVALASCLYRALGCEDSPENKRQSVYWYEKAALAGDVRAMELLASCLYNATGCEDSLENKRQSVYWYEKAALAGNVPSMAALAACLYRSIGCEDSPENKRFSIFWFEKASLAGDTASMVTLAARLYKARGCEDSPENKDKAVYWLRKAAELGNVNAMEQIGTLFLEAPGYKDMPAYTREGVKWLTIGMELGSTRCALDLGNIYFEGAKGVDKNHQLALVHFEKVKHKWTVSNLIAVLYLGQKNYTKALENYLEAIGQGFTVSTGLINFLLRKTKLPLRKRTDNAMSKKNNARDAAIASKLKEMEEDADAAKELYAQLLKQLDSRKELLAQFSEESTRVEALLEKIQNAYKLFEKGFEQRVDLFEKRKEVDAFNQILSEAEETLLVAEQELSNKINMEALRKKAKKEEKSYSPMDVGSEESPTKEVKAQAEKTLAKKKNRHHAKNMKKHGKPATTNSKKNSSPAESIKTSPVKGPFANMKKPVKQTQTQITDAAWANVYKIRDVLRDACSLENAMGQLNSLPGNFDFKNITPEYAGVPNADLAFEMRIDKQYRVIIAFVKDTELLQEKSGKRNNNILVKKVVYKLYGDTIYIKDPHIKG